MSRRSIAAFMVIAALALSSPLAAATIVVTAGNDLVNGNTSSPDALALNPGPDGITLREAILAANNAPGPHQITFTEGLAGSTIVLSEPFGLPAITRDGVSIVGTGSGTDPRITIDASAVQACCAAMTVNASDVSLTRLRIVGAAFTGVIIKADDGITSLARVTLSQSEFVDDGAGIIVIMSSPGDQVFSDITIAHNVFHRTRENNDIFVNQRAGPGLAGPLRLLNLRIEDNTFTSTSTGLTAHAIGVGTNGDAVETEISGVTIARNTFDGYDETETDAVIAGPSCTDCMFQGLRVLDNQFSHTTFPVELGTGGGPGGKVRHTQILRNRFEANEQPISFGTFGTSSGTIIEDTLIAKNVFVANTNPSIAIVGGVGASGNTISDVDIVNNVIAWASAPGGGIILNGGLGGATNNSIAGVRIVNNTIAMNAGTVVIVSQGEAGNSVSDVEVENTIFWANSSDFNTVVPCSFCLTSAGPDPKFVDPAAGDFHLQAGSPGIDAGTTAGAPQQDIDCRARSNPDIGAYEFNGAAGPCLRLVTVIKGGAGDGVVTGAPIACGTTCRAEVSDGTTVTLTATAAPSSEFTGWNGDCSGLGPCVITANSDVMAIASFRPATVSLAVAKTGTGVGSVASAPRGLSCGTKCTARVTRGKLVTLTATAASGSSFSRWSGACDGTGDCSVTMNGDASVAATFDANGSCTAPSAPTGLVASAVSPTSVSIVWTSAPGSATITYQIQRSSAGPGGFADLPGAITTGTTLIDTTAAANEAYLYRVVATNSCGTAASAWDLAATVLHDDDPLVAGSTIVRATHLTQLRTAVNAVRALAGLSAMTFTDSSPQGAFVRAVHVHELRGSVGVSGLDQAMGLLGLTTGQYSDALSPAIVIRAAHFQELRDRMK